MDDKNKSDFEKPENRLETFERWPIESPVYIKDLVEAGFCYTGKGDFVFCCRCKLVLGNWTDSQNPLERHKDENNECSYLIDRENVRNSIQKPSQSFRPSSFPSRQQLRPTVTSGLGNLGSHTIIASNAHESNVITSNQGNKPGILFINNSNVKIDLENDEIEIKRNAMSQEPRPKDKVDVPKLIIPAPNYNPTPQVRHSTNINTGLSPNLQQYPQPLNQNIARVGEIVPHITPSSTSPRLPSQRIPSSYSPLASSSHSPLFNPQLKNVDMTNKINRLHTFLTWPQDAFIQPLELAEAGFFYLGTGDGVKCHSCNIALRNWDIDDTAWGEHQKWSPNCQFIQEYQANQNTLRQSPATNTMMQAQVPLSAASYALPVEGVFHNSRSSSELMSLSSQPNSLSSQPHPISNYQSAHGFVNEPQTVNQSGLQIIGHNNTINQRSPNLQNYTGVSQPEFPQQYRRQSSSDFNIREYLSDSDIDNLMDAGFSLETIIKVQKAGYQKYQSYFISVEAIADAIMHYMEHGNLDSHTVHPSTPVDLPNQGQSNQPSNNNNQHNQSSSQRNQPNNHSNQASNQQNQYSSQLNQTSNQPNQASNQRIQTHNQPNQTTDQQNQTSNQRNQPSSIQSGAQSSSTASNSEEPKQGEDKADLQRELDRVKEMQTCKICMDEPVGIVFLPCGHLLACPTCSTGMEQCPLCRATIQSSSRIYLS